MLMANLKAVLTKPKISENYSRNAFDRSFSPKLTYNVGALQPFFAEPFIAGSHVKLNRSIFQRTAMVNTAAFPIVDTHCEFFYVPIRLLWSYWNNWKLNIQDFNSSYFGSVDSAAAFTPEVPSIPTFDLNSVRDAIGAAYSQRTGSAIPFYSADVPYFGNNGASQNLVLAVGANRLLDSLGYGFMRGVEGKIASDDYSSFFVNPFKLLAYQKIYYDHFRNTAYESNDPSYYNVDRWTQSNPMPYQVVSKMLTYRYVNYRKDYFQAIYPALNYTVSTPSGLNWVVPNSVLYAGPNSTPTFQSTSVNASSLNAGQVELNKPTYNYGAYGNITVQQIRAAFALDKLLRASAYAPKHVRDQFEARYGVKGVESGNESVRIGAYMSDIVFKEVVNMSTQLGAIGGKGIGNASFGQDIEFTCKEDCIIMGVMYSLPRASYDSLRVLNWNAKRTREDFFIPEYMNLGLQPLYKYEFLYSHDKPDFNVHVPGYVDRYQEYKCGIDVNHGNFNKNMPLSDFVTHTQDTYTNLNSPLNGVGSDYFKVKPYDLDSVFSQSTSLGDMSTDKFITYMDVKCICNQNMSVHGQPVNIGS